MRKSRLFLLNTLLLVSLHADELVKRTQVMMGTYVSISLAQDKLELSNRAFSRLKEVELALSSYDKNADIYKLNHLKKVKLSSDSFVALVLSEKYYQQTHGYFDITIGSITKGLFHFGEDERVPSTQELHEVRVEMNGLHFTQNKGWLEKGTVVDLGGMGKGFGVDKAVEVLKGLNKAVVALSGDIYCIGECLMSIQNPFKEGVIASFKMKDMAISTSGNYRRYVKSSKYNHLINPKTRASQSSFASITLVSNYYSNSDLDAYATASSVMPYAKAIAFLKEMKLGYLLIKTDKDILVNERFKQSVQDLQIFSHQQRLKREYIKAPPLIFQRSKRRLL